MARGSAAKHHGAFAAQQRMDAGGSERELVRQTMGIRIRLLRVEMDYRIGEPSKVDGGVAEGPESLEM